MKRRIIGTVVIELFLFLIMNRSFKMKKYFPLPEISNSKFLVVDTYKGDSDICTIARCVDVTNHGGYDSETFVVFEDFYKVISRTFPKRRTEKLITNQHTSFVENSDAVKSLLEEVVAFYKK